MCQAHKTRHSKRKALQLLNLNVPAKRRPTKALNPPESCPKPSIPPPAPLNLPKSRLKATIPLLNPLESRLEAPIYVPTPPPIQPQTLGFLPAD
jgi:hypothetical protein